MLFFLVPPEPARPVLVPRRTMALEVTVSSRLALLGSLDKVRDLLNGCLTPGLSPAPSRDLRAVPLFPPRPASGRTIVGVLLFPSKTVELTPLSMTGMSSSSSCPTSTGGSIGASIKDDVAMRSSADNLCVGRLPHSWLSVCVDMYMDVRLCSVRTERGSFIGPQSAADMDDVYVSQCAIKHSLPTGCCTGPPSM